LHDDGRIRIREAKKHVDPVDQDPEHCLQAYDIINDFASSASVPSFRYVPARLSRQLSFSVNVRSVCNNVFNFEKNKY
jgi:hypothetical protein